MKLRAKERKKKKGKKGKERNGREGKGNRSKSNLKLEENIFHEIMVTATV
jgi:hypothetical protein